MSETCSTCKNWTDQRQNSGEQYYDNAWDAARLSLGECSHATMLSQSTGFRKSKDIGQFENILPQGKMDEWIIDDDNPIIVELDHRRQMYVQDGSSYRATLYTKPDFYCAAYEPKDT